MTPWIVKPLRPSTLWVQCPVPSMLLREGYPVQAWLHEPTSIAVLSAVEVATDTDGSSHGPEYHLSMSVQLRCGPQRVDSAQARWVLAQFGLEGAQEDNHVPSGVVRNFWRPVADPLVGKECECKADEPAIREDKGDFVWRPWRE